MNEIATLGNQHHVVVGLVVGQVVFATLFVCLLLSAYHQPTPHELPVGVAASPAITQKLQVALDSHEPGGFDLRPYPTAGQARLGDTAPVEPDLVGPWSRNTCCDWAC